MYGKVEAKKSANVTPTSQISFHSTFYFDHVLSPQTPPRSPGLDLFEDENTEVVFAAKPDQLKIAEETANKRQRDDTVGEKKLMFADTVGERRGRTGEKKKLTFADTVEERGGRSVVKKLKFADMERKKERERGWGWRSAAISKPTKKKNSAIQQDNKLQQEP
ncbi:hypothetical protein Tco_1395896, partial [Tanacetum coccineum]